MSTRCIDLTAIPPVSEERETKYITFKKVVRSTSLEGEISFDLYDAYTPPKQYSTIELICRNYLNSSWDLMYAFTNNVHMGFLYFGYWNDGVVNEEE